MNRKTVRSLIRIALAALALYPLVAFLASRRVIVRGESMLPALHPGERVLFDRLAYVMGRPRPGDIVLARHSARPGLRVIKRVADTVAGDEYWLLGDNPDASTDSRTLGPFLREDIIARAWLVYWPPDRFRVIKRRAESLPRRASQR